MIEHTIANIDKDIRQISATRVDNAMLRFLRMRTGRKVKARSVVEFHAARNQCGYVGAGVSQLTTLEVAHVELNIRVPAMTSNPVVPKLCEVVALNDDL